MTLDRSIRKGARWLIAGNLGDQVLNFAFGIALARLLFPSDFGMMATIQVFTGFVGLLAAGGMGQALIRFKTVTKNDFYVVFTIQLLVGAGIFSIFYITAPFFASWFNDPLYRELLRVSAITFLLRPFANIHRAWLNREMRFKGQSLIALGTTIVAGAGSVLMALSGLGVWTLVLSGIIGALFNIALVSRLTPLRLRLALDKKILKSLGTYGVKVTLNDLIDYLAQRSNNLLISGIAGASMVGLYNKGESLAFMPHYTISASVYQPVFREMARSQDNLDVTKYLFYRMISLLIVYTLPFYVGLAWLSEPFVVTLYGEKWMEAADPLRILAICGIVFCIRHPCGAVLAAQNRLGREMATHAIRWFLVVAGTYVGLNWGLVGVAWAVLLSHAVSMILMFILVSQRLTTGLKDLLSAIAPGLLLNGILLISLLLVDVLLPGGFSRDSQAMYLIISTFVGIVVYGISLLFLPIPALSSESVRLKRVLKIG